MPTRELASLPSTTLGRPVDSLVEGAQAFVEGAKASATRKAYAGDWAAYEAWMAAEGLISLPLEEMQVARYLTALSREGLKVKTIERAYAGVVFHHRAAGHEWIGSNFLREMFKGLRKEHAKRGERPTKKQPITKDLLILMISALNTETLAGKRDRAVLLLAWTACARRSEVTQLRREDIEFYPEGMTIKPLKTKTDQEGQNTEKGIPYAQNEGLCATRAVQAWLDASGIIEGPLFRGLTLNGELRSGALTENSFATIVKKTAKLAGLDPEPFSGHSLRAGFITQATEDDVAESVIATQSGHKSIAVLRTYIRHANLFRKNAAKGLL